jgi:glycosyltransferase involved in cell wall biosynthesis
MNLILIFDYGLSLRVWDETGLIDREILLYKRLLDKGVQVVFITYGDEEDYAYQKKLGDIQIVPFYAYANRPDSRTIRFLHSFLLPFILRKKIKRADILKTNQMWGAWIVLLSKLLYRKRAIVRCGFERYLNALYKGESFLYKTFVWLNSWMAYKFSNGIILTSETAEEFVVKTFSIPSTKINLFMNYIDIDQFKKTNSEKHENKLLFIGRLNKGKNIFSLLDAIYQTDYELDIVGDGELRAEVEEYIKKHNIKANLIGRFPNARMPEIINRDPVYILPSFYEGNPKTLLEAMACESAVIGANVDGIKEIIKDNENGLLCETNSESIKEAINILMQDKNLRDRLGKNARSFVMENCDLGQIVEKEYNLYRELLNRNA